MKHKVADCFLQFAATSFNRSQLQTLTPLLEAIPWQLSTTLSSILSLAAGLVFIVIIFMAKEFMIDQAPIWCVSAFIHSTFPLTLGDPLRMVLDNVVKELPLQNTARELTEDLVNLLSSFTVRFNSNYFCF